VSGAIDLYMVCAKCHVALSVCVCCEHKMHIKRHTKNEKPDVTNREEIEGEKIKIGWKPLEYLNLKRMSRI
jgi:hypothetical protein